MEQTDKKWKRIEAIGFVGLVLAGALFIFVAWRPTYDVPSAFVQFSKWSIAAASLMVWGVGRFGGWWHHG